MVSHHRILTIKERGLYKRVNPETPIGSISTSDGKCSVSVSWYDQSQGLVAWKFTNNDIMPHSLALYRNSYIFGGAFWAVYVANSNGRGASATNPADDFGVDWLDGSKLIPVLVDNGEQNNAAPIAIRTDDADLTKLNGSDSGGDANIGFVFTIAPNSSWSILEGGFSTLMPPVVQGLYYLAPITAGNYCIGYDSSSVMDWDTQTNTTFQGYSPNPSIMNTYAMLLEKEGNMGQYLFNNVISLPPCPAPQPQPSCLQQIEDGLSTGNWTEVLDGIVCLFETGNISVRDLIKRIAKEDLEEVAVGFKEMIEGIRKL